MRMRRWSWLHALGIICLLLGIAVGSVGHVGAAPRQATAELSLADLHAFFFIWASGTPEIQKLANETCAQMAITPVACGKISDAVRAAWLDLATHDPAATGRLFVAPHLSVRSLALQTLASQLDALTDKHATMLRQATHVNYTQVSDPNWARQALARQAHPIPLTAIPVWATSYLQTALPAGMDSYTSPYVALPDVYLKFANLGNGAAIPSLYQPYYLPPSGAAHWSVSISQPGTTTKLTNIPITDVGPWNEDDNWWDPNGTSTTPPAGCPVASPLPLSDATSNPLVNGICPDGRNLRRLYYYLLYTHGGLPFFQGANVRSSGVFRDGTAWPAMLPRFCAESVAASINDMGLSCASGLAGYNGSNGAWSRDGTFNSPVLNQASIDLGPAVDRALGWTYPSSGLVLVSVGNLP